MLMVNDSRGQDAMTISRPKAATTRRPTFDPLLVVMALGFALAVAAMVYPAFRANAFTAPGLILIFAAGATALIWLFAFGREIVMASCPRESLTISIPKLVRAP